MYAERGAEAVRSLLAIMKTGAGYLPLDPSLPPGRLAGICAQTRPVAVLAERADRKLSRTGTIVIPVGELTAELARQPDSVPDVALHPDHLGYVIHTSGSTGQPKAVAVSHGSLAGVIGELAGAYGISPRDRVAQLASLAFDTSLEQILVTLSGGATLMLPPAGTIAPSDLLGYVEREQVTVIDLTPAYWHQLLAVAGPGDPRLRSLRLMITGGDLADPADVRAARRAAPAARLLNAYGLTETAITSAVGEADAEVVAGGPGPVPVGPVPVGPVPVGPVPVGRAVGHARIMVLDGQLRPAPAGTPGEIYLGGAVARGYLGRPALTAEMFLPDPGGEPGSRMYRTGDLGRWREDGLLEVTGRADRQLKVRGFRVEPGEIETVLATYPGIGQVAVVATTGQGPGDTRLAAHYTLRHTGRPPGPPPSAAGLRRYLRARLPGYMIPAVFVALEKMPPMPGAPAAGAPSLETMAPETMAPQAGHTAPDGAGGEARTPVQAGLTYLWSRLLKQEHVGLDDDFFSLGGNSLLAAEMLARARGMFGIGAEYTRPLTRCLLRDPTLRGFAQAAQDARAGLLAADGDQARVDFGRELRLAIPAIPASAGPASAGPATAGPVTGGPVTAGGPGWDWHRPVEVLLTGSTGFLGAHLLRDLLDATSARIWCLVRADDAAHARQRIAGAAARYDLAPPPGDRVVPLPGDLARPRLGLAAGEFRELARSIGIIYHAGAVVNFIYPYEELRAANVNGTREIIRLASLERVIPVHYVSTTAVLAGLGVMGVRRAGEDTPLAHPDRLRVGYVETKYVAEELLRRAGRAGLPVAIYRPLDIVGSRRTGAWNTATEMCALIRFITDTGLAPDIDLPLDFVPADICAAAIRHISARDGATGRTYHLASSRHAGLGAVVGRLRDHGFEVSQIPFGIWVRELLRHAADNPSHPMTPFLPLFVDRDPESGLTPAEMYLEHTFPHYTSSNTERALAGSGVAFPPVDDALLDRNIGRLIETGYLRTPGRHQAPAWHARAG